MGVSDLMDDLDRLRDRLAWEYHTCEDARARAIIADAVLHLIEAETALMGVGSARVETWAQPAAERAAAPLRSSAARTAPTALTAAEGAWRPVRTPDVTGVPARGGPVTPE